MSFHVSRILFRFIKNTAITIFFVARCRPWPCDNALVRGSSGVSLNEFEFGTFEFYNNKYEIEPPNFPAANFEPHSFYNDGGALWEV